MPVLSALIFFQSGAREKMRTEGCFVPSNPMKNLYMFSSLVNCAMGDERIPTINQYVSAGRTASVLYAFTSMQ